MFEQERHDDNAMVDAKWVMNFFGWSSRTSIHNKLKDPDSGFPRPIYLSKRDRRWVKAEIYEYVDRLSSCRESRRNDIRKRMGGDS